MNIQRLLNLLLFLVFLEFGLIANTSAQTEEPLKIQVPLPPNLLNTPHSTDDLEPTVTVRNEGDREIEEYRLRGRLFAMRVKVKQAPSYWLIDLDGSGRMVPGQGIGTSISMPQWVLKEF
jgi:Protein of unknown function (DUF2782)